MNLLKMKLDGFKNIYDTEIEFSNITALLSLNNYGKSNLIEGLKFALDFIIAPKQIKSMMMKKQTYFPINTENANSNFCFEIEYISDTDSTQYVQYGFQFSWLKDGNKGATILYEYLKMKNTDDEKYTTYVKREMENSGLYKQSKTGRADKELTVERDELIINKLQHYDLFFTPILNELHSVYSEHMDFYNPNNLFDFNPIQFGDNKRLTIDKDNVNNISEIVHELKENSSDMYELLINTFKDLFPQIVDVKVIKQNVDFEINQDFEIFKNAPFKLNQIKYDLFVFDKNINQPINISLLSTGTKRIFLFLLEVILAEKNKVPLISFEELENCLHPSLFQNLLDILSQIATNTKILITSHSPHLVQFLYLDKIYIGVPSVNGLAQFKRIKKTKHKSIEKESDSQGNYIFDKLIEAYSEPSIIEEWF